MIPGMARVGLGEGVAVGSAVGVAAGRVGVAAAVGAGGRVLVGAGAAGVDVAGDSISTTVATWGGAAAGIRLPLQAGRSRPRARMKYVLRMRLEVIGGR
jgi:hypothetical protein